MACTTTIALMDWQGLSANSATAVFVPAGPWRPATGITSAKGWGEMAGRTVNMKVEPAVQVANDVRAPGGGSVTVVGSAMIANGVSDPTGAVAVATGSSKYIRPGWYVSFTAGGAFSTANCCGVIEFIAS